MRAMTFAVAMIAFWLSAPVQADGCGRPGKEGTFLAMSGEIAEVSERVATQSADLLLGEDLCADDRHPVGATYDRFDVRETIDRAMKIGEAKSLAGKELGDLSGL